MTGTEKNQAYTLTYNKVVMGYIGIHHIGIQAWRPLCASLASAKANLWKLITVGKMEE